jgi:hypothetical protein
MVPINWKGEWIPDKSPFDKAGEYSLKQDLISELMEVAKKYHGRIKNATIAEAANVIVKHYEALALNSDPDYSSKGHP